MNIIPNLFQKHLHNSINWGIIFLKKYMKDPKAQFDEICDIFADI